MFRFPWSAEFTSCPCHFGTILDPLWKKEIVWSPKRFMLAVWLCAEEVKSAWWFGQWSFKQRARSPFKYETTSVTSTQRFTLKIYPECRCSHFESFGPQNQNSSTYPWRFRLQSAWRRRTWRKDKNVVQLWRAQFIFTASNIRIIPRLSYCNFNTKYTRSTN